MKKTICLLLAVVMVIGLMAGCGSSGSSSAPASSGNKAPAAFPRWHQSGYATVLQRERRKLLPYNGYVFRRRRGLPASDRQTDL